MKMIPEFDFIFFRSIFLPLICCFCIQLEQRQHVIDDKSKPEKILRYKNETERQN